MPFTVFVGALVASGALMFFALVVVYAAKTNRDRRERLQARRVASLKADLCGDEAVAHDALYWAVNGRYSLQTNLLAVLAADPGARTCARAVAAADDTIRDKLRRQTSRRSPILRGVALLLMGQLATGDLETIYRSCHDRDSDVRQCAVQALGAMQTTESAAALIRVLADTDPTELAPERVLATLAQPWAATHLWEALGRASRPSSRLHPSETRTADPQVIGILRAVAAGGFTCPDDSLLVDWVDYGSQRERVCALQAIRSCCQQAPDAIVRYLDDSDPIVVAQVAATLAALPAPQHVTEATLPRLADLLSSPDWWVRLYSAQALASLGDGGIAALRTASRSDDPYAAERAVEALEAAGMGSA